MAYQTTIKSKTSFRGVGLHSGTEVTLSLRPADSGTGVIFHRIDVAPPVSIEACSANVVNTRLSTTIGKNGTVVATIEHLMAALLGAGIDNVHVDINGPEVPIMDGSAAPFLAGISEAGRVTLPKARKYLVVKKPVTVADGDKKVTITPSRFFQISFDIRFDHPTITNQSRMMTFAEETFASDFSAARTFGFLSDVEMLKANGLAQGGSLENAVVIGAEGVLNPEGLRFDDEFVRHKILDSLGDLALAGHRIFGHVKAFKSGHDLNHKLVTKLLAQPDCWKLVESAPPDGGIAPFPLQELAWMEA